MVFQDPILAGTTLVRDSIASENYVQGSAGWSITRDGNAEFNSAVVRGSLQAGPDGGPHIKLGGAPPAELVAASPDFVWAQAEVMQTGPSTYVFRAVGTHVVVPPFVVDVYAEGVWTGSRIVFYRIVQNAGVLNSEQHGSDIYNADTIDWSYERGRMIWGASCEMRALGPNGSVSSPSRGHVGTQGLVTGGAVATSAGSEIAVPALSWAQEPHFTAEAGHVYKVTVQCGAGISAAGVNSFRIRLRLGSGSISGRELGHWQHHETTNFAFVNREMSCLVRCNLTTGAIDAPLSVTVTRLAGAQDVSLYGDTTSQPFQVRVEDLGPGAGLTALAATMV